MIGRHGTVDSFYRREKTVVVLNWCARANPVKLCAMKVGTVNYRYWKKIASKPWDVSKISKMFVVY